LLSRGNLFVFVERPISAWFVGACALLLGVQMLFFFRGKIKKRRAGATTIASLENQAHVSAGQE
ncbi:MAG: hypothetical protein ABI155_02960, partial [Paralcaligenes sp.]